jgi:hypothetical protein
MELWIEVLSSELLSRKFPESLRKKFLISCLGTCGSSAASFLPTLWNLLGLTEYGVWMTIHSCLTSSVLHSTAPPLLKMILCPLKDLCLALQIQETLPRKPSSIERGSTTCTSQLWVLSMMSRLVLSGNTVPFCLTYLESALGGGRLTRFD